MTYKEIFGISTGYIRQHGELAEARLAELIKLYGLHVVARETVSDGWLDGMKVLRVVAQILQTLACIDWSDGNKDFMVRCASGSGQVSLHPEKDLV